MVYGVNESVKVHENSNGLKKSDSEKIQDDLKAMGITILKFTFYDESSFKVETYAGSITPGEMVVNGKTYEISGTDVTTDDEHDEGLSYYEYEYELKNNA